MWWETKGSKNRTQSDICRFMSTLDNPFQVKSYIMRIFQKPYIQVGTRDKINYANKILYGWKDAAIYVCTKIHVYILAYSCTGSESIPHTTNNVIYCSLKCNLQLVHSLPCLPTRLNYYYSSWHAHELNYCTLSDAHYSKMSIRVFSRELKHNFHWFTDSQIFPDFVDNNLLLLRLLRAVSFAINDPLRHCTSRELSVVTFPFSLITTTPNSICYPCLSTDSSGCRY